MWRKATPFAIGALLLIGAAGCAATPEAPTSSSTALEDQGEPDTLEPPFIFNPVPTETALAQEAQETELPGAPEPDPAPPLVPAPKAPPAAVACPSGALVGTVVSVDVTPETLGQQVVTVTGVVQNAGSADVLLSRGDTPNVTGYDITGGVQLIELYGEWDNTARDTFLLPPRVSLRYTTTSTEHPESLRKIIAIYSAPEVGGLFAEWNDGAYIGCGKPLMPASKGIDYPFSWTGN